MNSRGGFIYIHIIARHSNQLDTFVDIFCISLQGYFTLATVLPQNQHINYLTLLATENAE